MIEDDDEIEVVHWNEQCIVLFNVRGM